MRNGELVHQSEKEGFVVRLYLESEDRAPDWDFESNEEEEEEELLRKINNGVLLWFCAHVEVSKLGHALGHDYLGRCCYASAQDFIDDAYFRDMVENAIDDARKTLKMLNEG